MRIIRSFASSLIYHALLACGSTEAGPRILCYHRVNDETSDYMTVPVASFKRQMAWLAEAGYRTASLQDLLRGQIGKKSVIVTFDDGYRDNYENAFPVMRSYGFTGTIFCVAKRIGEPSYLRRDDIEEMRRWGFEFGSHTMTHPHLPQLDEDRQWQEIYGSKKHLEDLLGCSMNFFCYPYGEYDARALKLVEKAGYVGACSNIPGHNKRLTPFLLRRTEIAAGDTFYDFQKKFAGAFDLLHALLHRLRGRP